MGGDVYDRIKETKEVVSFLNKNLKDIQTQEERIAYFYEFIENVDTYYGPYVTPGVLKLFKTPGVLQGINEIMGYDPVKFSEDEEAYEKYLESIDKAGRGSYKNVKVK